MAHIEAFVEIYDQGIILRLTCAVLCKHSDLCVLQSVPGLLNDSVHCLFSTCALASCVECVALILSVYVLRTVLLVLVQ